MERIVGVAVSACAGLSPNSESHRFAPTDSIALSSITAHKPLDNVLEKWRFLRRRQRGGGHWPEVEVAAKGSPTAPHVRGRLFGFSVSRLRATLVDRQLCHLSKDVVSISAMTQLRDKVEIFLYVKAN
jgi:hypothetical protein